VALDFTHTFEGHSVNWTCQDSNAGPIIKGTNLRLRGPLPDTTPSKSPSRGLVLGFGITLPMLFIIGIIIILLVSYPWLFSWGFAFIKLKLPLVSD